MCDPPLARHSGRIDSPEIIVVGSFVQDLTFQCAAFPRPGETIIGQLVTGPGGKGSNQAVAAVRAGGKVAFLGALGRDAFAESARAFHAREGIECLAVEKPEHPTGAAGILVNAHGQNEIVVALGANGFLAREDVEQHVKLIAGAKVLVAQLEANLEATSYALECGRVAGAIVVLNPAPMRADFDPAMLASVDILIPNETEFAALVNRLPTACAVAGERFDETKLEHLSEAELHAICRQFETPTLIVTLGARGYFISHVKGYASVQAVRGIQAIDTTGAGDAFVGAFAAALAENGVAELEQAARFANSAAAISVTRPGTAPAMPTRAEIEALLAAQLS